MKVQRWYRVALHVACGATLLNLTTCIAGLQDSANLVFGSNAPENAIRVVNSPLLQAALEWVKLWVP